MLSATKRFFTTGTTDYIPRPKDTDRGIDHFQAIVKAGLFRLPENPDDHAFVMRNIEKISETRVGTELMLRLRQAVAKSGAILTIRMGNNNAHIPELRTVLLARSTEHIYAGRRNKYDFELSRPSADSSLLHEMIHLLHAQEDPISHIYRSNKAKGRFAPFHTFEELATITGHTESISGTFYDPVNQNAYLRELRRTERHNHSGYDETQMINRIIGDLETANTPRKMLGAISALRGAIKGRFINASNAQAALKSGNRNPEMRSMVEGELLAAGLIQETTSPRSVTQLDAQLNSAGPRAGAGGPSPMRSVTEERAPRVPTLAA